MTMNVVTWIFLGLIAGFMASKLVNRRGEGVGLDIVLGSSARSPAVGSSTQWEPSV